MLGLVKADCLVKACSSASATPLAAPQRPARRSSLPRSIGIPPRGLTAARRAHLVNAATVERTETDLTAELKDVLSRVKPKVHMLQISHQDFKSHCEKGVVFRLKIAADMLMSWRERG